MVVILKIKNKTFNNFESHLKIEEMLEWCLLILTCIECQNHSKICQE